MTQSRSHLLRLVIALLTFGVSMNSYGQNWRNETKIHVLFGLSQPLLAHGFNVEGNFIHKRFIFDYSHGMSLDFKNNTVNSELRKQGVAIHMPWTTGFGLGYRLTEWLNIRIEPKFHRFEFYYENQSETRNNQITSYNTVTVGLGLYGSYRPFKNVNGFLSGILIAPSVRFWPTVYSTSKNDFSYFDQHTGANEQIKTLGPGINQTPLIINVSVGYSFKLKKRR